MGEKGAVRLPLDCIPAFYEPFSPALLAAMGKKRGMIVGKEDGNDQGIHDTAWRNGLE